MDLWYVFKTWLRSQRPKCFFDRWIDVRWSSEKGMQYSIVMFATWCWTLPKLQYTLQRSTHNDKHKEHFRTNSCTWWAVREKQREIERKRVRRMEKKVAQFQSSWILTNQRSIEWKCLQAYCCVFFFFFSVFFSFRFHRCSCHFARQDKCPNLIARDKARTDEFIATYSLRFFIKWILYLLASHWHWSISINWPKSLDHCSIYLFGLSLAISLFFHSHI